LEKATVFANIVIIAGVATGALIWINSPAAASRFFADDITIDLNSIGGGSCDFA